MHISHIRPNHLSGYALVPLWPDNRGRTVLKFIYAKAELRCNELFHSFAFCIYFFIFMFYWIITNDAFLYLGFPVQSHLA